MVASSMTTFRVEVSPVVPVPVMVGRNDDDDDDDPGSKGGGAAVVVVVVIHCCGIRQAWSMALSSMPSKLTSIK